MNERIRCGGCRVDSLVGLYRAAICDTFRARGKGRRERMRGDDRETTTNGGAYATNRLIFCLDLARAGTGREEVDEEREREKERKES